MKGFISLIIIISFMLLGLKETVIIGFYEVNKEYITKNFCVNKEKPEMKCDGKCHMKKMIKKTKEQEQESFPEGTLELKIIAYVKPDFKQIFNSVVISKIIESTFYHENLHGSLSFQEIFRPPQV